MRIRTVLACLGASAVFALVGSAVSVSSAQASSGNWCYSVSLSQGQDCYSGHESNLYAIHAWSDDSLVWAWLYNTSASPSSNSGYCEPAGCTEYLNLSTGGYGYQELEAYSEPYANPDWFFGTWNS
jgi:hypothetical protein